MQNDRSIADDQAVKRQWSAPRVEKLDVASTRSGAAILNEDLIVESTTPS